VLPVGALDVDVVDLATHCGQRTIGNDGRLAIEVDGLADAEGEHASSGEQAAGKRLLSVDAMARCVVIVGSSCCVSGSNSVQRINIEIFSVRQYKIEAVCRNEFNPMQDGAGCS
jgi:hypothetical protein